MYILVACEESQAVTNFIYNVSHETMDNVSRETFRKEAKT